MSRTPEITSIKPIHPFPARMAPSIVWDSLPDCGKRLRILDPMAGSGTTLVSARAKGHKALGCDTDPLALLIARTWCSDINIERLKYRGDLVLERAKKYSENLMPELAYPSHADNETKKFIDFWFDDINRIQLTALARCISHVHDLKERMFLWCAFSRLIITKSLGASLAMDISHSRPHKKYTEAPIRPFNKFIKALGLIIRNAPFRNNIIKIPSVILQKEDARHLPFRSNSIDMVITSPPYLNAIDYIRGHKFSLVWMGHSIISLRSIRSDNIGSECSDDMSEISKVKDVLEQMVNVKKLDRRKCRMIVRYISDMNRVLAECRRVLKTNGLATFVIGDSLFRGVFVKNSKGLIYLAHKNGLNLISQTTRKLPENRRYLPPPNKSSGKNLQNRMRKEVILKFIAE